MCVILLALVASSVQAFVGPRASVRAPARLEKPVARTAHRAARLPRVVVAAAGSAEGDSLDETPADERAWLQVDNLVLAGDVYGQWFDARVLELRTAAGAVAEARVEYVGWDGWDPEWVPRARLAYRPAAPMGLPPSEYAPADPAEELKKRESHDMWQFSQFDGSFAGAFRCARGERYVAEGRDLVLGSTFSATLDVTRTDGEEARAHEAWAATVAERRDGAPGVAPFVLTPGTFRMKAAGGGAAANAGAFTRAALVDGRELAMDLWMRAGPRLLQLRVSYARAPPRPGRDGAWDFAYADVSRFADAAAAEAVEDDDSVADLGAGIYDVHRRLREMSAAAAAGSDAGIHELRLGGRVTAAFPRMLSVDAGDGVNARGGGVVSLDWNAPGSEARVQVDRVFNEPDGSLASFEITDILKEDAANYPAGF